MADPTVRERMTTAERLAAWVAEFQKQQGRKKIPALSGVRPLPSRRGRKRSRGPMVGIRQRRREVRAASNVLGDELLGCVVDRITKRLGDTRSAVAGDTEGRLCNGRSASFRAQPARRASSSSCVTGANLQSRSRTWWTLVTSGRSSFDQPRCDNQPSRSRPHHPRSEESRCRRDRDHDIARQGADPTVGATIDAG
jgi:hypothetical protein